MKTITNGLGKFICVILALACNIICCIILYYIDKTFLDNDTTIGIPLLFLLTVIPYFCMRPFINLCGWGKKIFINVIFFIVGFWSSVFSLLLNSLD